VGTQQDDEDEAADAEAEEELRGDAPPGFHDVEGGIECQACGAVLAQRGRAEKHRASEKCATEARKRRCRAVQRVLGPQPVRRAAARRARLRSADGARPRRVLRRMLRCLSCTARRRRPRDAPRRLRASACGAARRALGAAALGPRTKWLSSIRIYHLNVVRQHSAKSTRWCSLRSRAMLCSCARRGGGRQR
jgi:hypothetical protein